MGTMPPGICGAMPWLLTGIMPFGGCPPGICSHCIEPVSGLSRLSAARSSEYGNSNAHSTCTAVDHGKAHSMRLLVLLHRVHVLVLLLLHLDRAIHVRLPAGVHLARHHAIRHALLPHHAVALLSQEVRVVTAGQHRYMFGMPITSIRRNRMVSLP